MGQVEGFGDVALFIRAYFLSCIRGRAKGSLCAKSPRDYRRNDREGAFWAKQEKASLIVFSHEGRKMDSAKKMRVDQILHSDTEDVMHYQ